MTSPSPLRRTLGAALLVLTGGVTALPPASTVLAASVVVETVAELRAEIDTLNAGNDGVADVIILGNAGPFLLPCGTSEDDNLDGDLDIASSDELTITYTGVGRATIGVDQSGVGCDTERVIHHLGANTLRLERVVITGGDLSASSVGSGDGGGIYAPNFFSPVELVDVVVEANRARDAASPVDPAGRGGGIATAGPLTILNSTVQANEAGHGAPGVGVDGGPGGDGGGVWVRNNDVTVTVTNTTVSSNRAGDGGVSDTGRGGGGGDGGGMFLQAGTLVMNGGVIGGSTSDAGNVAGAGGSGDSGGGGGSGGGVRMVSSNASIEGTEWRFNAAGVGGDAADGPAAIGGHGGALELTGNLELTGSMMTDNSAGAGGTAATGRGGSGGNGGGISVAGLANALTVVDSTIAGNQAGAGGPSAADRGGFGGGGGGLYYRGESLTISASTIVDNDAGPSGDGPGGTSSAGPGGGLYALPSFNQSGTVVVSNSTIDTNRAGRSPTGVIGGSPGGGRIDVGPDGTLTFERSTVSGNEGERAAGLLIRGGDLRVVNSTFDGNTGTSQGGGLTVDFQSTATIEASTFFANGALEGSSVRVATGSTATIARSALGGALSGSECSGTIVDGGDNREQATSTCGFTTVPDFVLGPLRDNGGATLTRLPGPGSPLIDAVASADCPETEDQRDGKRDIGAGCDVGSVEVNVDVDASDDEVTVIATDVTVDVLANDTVTDGDIDPGSVTILSGPASGGASVDPLTGEITYSAVASGSVEIEYEVCAVGYPDRCDNVFVRIDLTLPDDTPDAFEFVDQVGVPVSSSRTSSAVVVSGVNVSVPVSVTGGTYSVNGGAFTASSGSVIAGDSVRVRHTASASPSTAVDTTLSVGGVSDTFTSTTAAPVDPPVEPPTLPAGASRFVPLSPVRLFDTRDGTGVAGAGKVPADGALDVQVTGNAGVPAGAAAVVVNITVDQPDGPAFVTAYPRGASRPLASTLNITTAGQIRPNLAIVPLSDDGGMSIYAQNGMHLLGDVAGYFESIDGAQAAGRIVPLDPARVFDTRPTEPGNGPKAFVGADDSISVQVAGVANVPATGVSAVVLNVTATESAGPNFVTVWPTGSPRPLASSLNVDTNGTAANLVIVPLGDDGQVDLYTLSGAHLLADVTGYVTDDTSPADTAGLFVPLDPGRVFDTRPTEPGNGPKGFVAAGSSITTQTAGVTGVPDDAAAVVLNVTATQAATGFITGWPSGDGLPLASTLNLQGPSDTRANAAILPIGDGGGIDYFSQTGAHLIADTSGYLLG